MNEIFSNLVKEKDTQVQGVQRISNKVNPKKLMPKYNIIKMAKLYDKERILKATREK